MKHLFVDNMRGFQRRIDGKHYAPYSKALLFHADGTKYDNVNNNIVCRDRSVYKPKPVLGHSCLVENGDSLQFQHDIELDESLSSYTCTFTVSSDELVVDVAGEINKLVTVAGAVFIPTPSGFRNIGTAMGIQLGVGVGDFTHLSDSSCFWMEENGFAVKTNVLYPMKIDKSGYAGLVGSADKYFPRGMISRRGSIDIEAWNYLDTLIDFGGSAGVMSAGIIINQFDGTDCNDDLITTAEPKLDPAEIAILVPASGDDIELDKNFTVSGTSNCANVKIEASADGTTWVTLAASVAVSAGAFSKADCQLPSADFDPNDEVTIRVSDVDSISLPDTVAIDTIATITITPAIGNQTAGVAFDVAGTTNLPDGAEVEVFAGATSKGDATVASGAFTKSVTIADPVNDVVIKVEDKLNANANDTEEIDVVSGETMIDDFESYSVGQSLTSYAPWACHSWLGAVVSDTYAYSGSKSMRIDMVSSSGYQAEVSFSTIDMTGKKVSIRVRRADTASVAGYEISLFNSSNGYVGGSGYISSPSISSTSFTELKPTLTGTLTSVAKIGIEIRGTDGEKIYIDDIKIV